MRRRLTADGSSSVRMVSESCHHSPSTGPRRPSASIAVRSLWLIARTSAGLVAVSYRTVVRPSRSVGSFDPFAWRMNVRRMPSAPPKRPASNTTLSRGAASPAGDASVAAQPSGANTNGAKSTSGESATSRSSVDRPGLKVVVQGSTSATSASPRVIAWISFACLPDEPRKMRGLLMDVIHDDGAGLTNRESRALHTTDAARSRRQSHRAARSGRLRDGPRGRALRRQPDSARGALTGPGGGETAARCLLHGRPRRVRSAARAPGHRLQPALLARAPHDPLRPDGELRRAGAAARPRQRVGASRRSGERPQSAADRPALPSGDRSRRLADRLRRWAAREALPPRARGRTASHRLTRCLAGLTAGDDRGEATPTRTNGGRDAE